jgi:hypothetical protein
LLVLILKQNLPDASRTKQAGNPLLQHKKLSIGDCTSDQKSSASHLYWLENFAKGIVGGITLNAPDIIYQGWWPDESDKLSANFCHMHGK